ncbi:MAG: TIGR00304 family membrane protein [Candidatus Bathyarchaeales archaeon]
MVNEENREAFEEGITLSKKFFSFLIIGLTLIIMGIMVIVFATAFNGHGLSAGAVIFIGPFPIVIAAGPDATSLVPFSIILAVLSIVIFFVMNRKLRFNS